MPIRRNNGIDKTAGGWTLTGTADGKRQVKAIRREWKGPRKGDLAERATKRPAF